MSSARKRARASAPAPAQSDDCQFSLPLDDDVEAEVVEGYPATANRPSSSSTVEEKSSRPQSPSFQSVIGNTDDVCFGSILAAAKSVVVSQWFLFIVL
jgi:hypothetical protein